MEDGQVSLSLISSFAFYWVERLIHRRMRSWWGTPSAEASSLSKLLDSVGQLSEILVDDVPVNSHPSKWLYFYVCAWGVRLRFDVWVCMQDLEYKRRNTKSYSLLYYYWNLKWNYSCFLFLAYLQCFPP